MGEWIDEFECSDEDDDRLIPDDEDDDERSLFRGTSACDGLCDPRCDWCLVGHYCPDECLGGPCPYESLAPHTFGERDFALGYVDAMGLGKRARLGPGVSRRYYLRGFEACIRRKDPRRRRKEAAKRRLDSDIRSWGDVW